MPDFRSDEELVHWRNEAEQALAAKDALHREIGAYVDGEIDRVSAAWHRVEVALQAEQLTWIQVHASPALQQQTEDALSAGRVGGHQWRPGVPLDWDQAERLAALQPQLTREWLAHARPGWAEWSATDAELKPVTPELSRPVDGPDVVRTAPVQALVRAAATHDRAELCSYTAPDSLAGARSSRFCAVSTVRLPGGYTPMRVALKESPEQERQLNAMFDVLGGPSASVQTYAEKLAAIAEIETGRRVTRMGAQAESIKGRVARIDPADDCARAIIVCDEVTHIFMLDRDALQGSVGKDVSLGRGTDERTFIAAAGEAVVVGYEDIDAVQQLELRRTMRQLSVGADDLAQRAAARVTLLEVGQRVEQRMAECRAFAHGVDRQEEFLGPLSPKLHELRRDSALVTEQMAWVVAHGSQQLAQSQSRRELETGVRDEWLRSQPGWRAQDGNERGWKRVATDGGTRTVHPSLTLRDTAPVKEMMADAWTHAPDAMLAARFDGDAAARSRPKHCAVIARRAPGATRVEPLIRDETAKQRLQLDVIWKERARARDAAAREPCLLEANVGPRPPQNATERIIDRVQREFGLPAVSLPDAGPVTGRLARVERGSDHRHRALVVNASHVHVVSVLASTQLEQLVGKQVTVEKTAGRVKIAGLERETGLSR